MSNINKTEAIMDVHDWMLILEHDEFITLERDGDTLTATISPWDGPLFAFLHKIFGESGVNWSYLVAIHTGTARALARVVSAQETR